MDVRQKLAELDRNERLLAARSASNTAPLRWSALGASAAVALIAAAIFASQIVLAVCLLGLLLASVLTAIITAAVVRRQNLPIQVRFGDSTIGVHVDASSYAPEVRHRVTAAIAEFSLECLKQGSPPDWRRSELSPAVKPQVLVPSENALSVLSAPAAVENVVRPEVCYSCKRRNATTVTATGNPVCGLCNRTLFQAGSNVLQTASVDD